MTIINSHIHQNIDNQKTVNCDIGLCTEKAAKNQFNDTLYPRCLLTESYLGHQKSRTNIKKKNYANNYISTTNLPPLQCIHTYKLLCEIVLEKSSWFEDVNATKI